MRPKRRFSWVDGGIRFIGHRKRENQMKTKVAKKKKVRVELCGWTSDGSDTCVRREGHKGDHSMEWTEKMKLKKEGTK